MNELDTVVLIKEFKKLSVGTIGCIVHKYDERNFEVEFFGKEGNIIAVYTIDDEYLKQKIESNNYAP